MHNYNTEIHFAKNLALQAGKIIRENFGLSFEAKEKEDKSPVTIIDEQVNQLVIDEIAKAFPSHTVLGEEKSSIKSSIYAWTCDPIDGTIPFTLGIPVSVFGLALLLDGSPVLGVIYDPYTERLYSAVKGQGAQLNGKKIKVNNKKLDRDSIINIDWWPEAEYDIQKPLTELCKSKEFYMLTPGSVMQAGALTARGAFSAAIFVGTKGKFVDIAPIKIIVEEAGGKVTDLFGSEQRYDCDIKGAVISNGVIHQELLDALKVLR